MPNIRGVIHRTLITGAAVLMFGLAPAPAALAAATPKTAPAASTATSSSTKSSTTTQGPAKPTGPDAATYQYNKDTGMWENSHYIWNPATNQTTPKDKQTYSYNPATGMWDTTKYVYDAPSGTYVPNVVATSQPPAGASVVTPAASTTTPSSSDKGAVVSGGANPSNSTGPNNSGGSTSNNGVNLNNNASQAFNTFYDASISNTLDSAAQSGDAVVMGNTQGGGATTGSADDEANLINMLQSQASFDGTNLTTFTDNIQGDVTGDLLIDPAQLTNVQAANNTLSNNSNLKINSQANGQINNDLNVGADSGNANVSGNTSAGDATSGTANAVANVVNMINSVTAASSSFIGTINIYGNLDGDILLPPSELNTLLQSNLPRATINTANLTNTSQVLAQFNDTEAINNNVNSNAASGDATVSGNTTAGNATSGNANTNVTILNLTGRQIVGSDALLVFVNVLGSWIGLITNAPAGTTAAALGGGITNASSSTNAELNVSTNNQINNNLNLNAKSGNANVSRNTQAGNATTGSATASANIANLINTNLNLSNWFGVLFINVFGSWDGSFGVNTAAGSHTTTSGGSGGGSTTASATPFRYTTTRHTGSTYFNSSGTGTPSETGTTTTSNTPNAVLADANLNTNPTPTVPAHINTSKKSKPSFNLLPMFGGLAGLTVLSTEKIVSSRKRRK